MRFALLGQKPSNYDGQIPRQAEISVRVQKRWYYGRYTVTLEFGPNVVFETLEVLSLREFRRAYKNNLGLRTCAGLLKNREQERIYVD